MRAGGWSEEDPVETIGKYRVLEPIGVGGAGVVYRARDTQTGTEVAIKVPRYKFDETANTRRARFLQEAVSTKGLSHPNIVAVYEHGDAEGRPYIVMERLEGEDLKTKLARRGSLGVAETLRLVLEIAKGLAHAHRKGVVHRDIKPANVFACSSGRVKILDFGLAMTPDSAEPDCGRALGTPYYMSPEQVLGDPLDHRSDIFSLGSLFYELLTGRKAFGFGAQRLVELVACILKEEPPPIEELRPAVPRAVETIVRKAIAKAPADRYQSVEGLVRDLEQVVASTEVRLEAKRKKLVTTKRVA